MSASKTDNRVYTHMAPLGLRTVDPRTHDEVNAIIAAAATRTVIKFAGDAADVVLEALFGEVLSGTKPVTPANAGRWPRKEVSA